VVFFMLVVNDCQFVMRGRRAWIDFQSLFERINRAFEIQIAAAVDAAQVIGILLFVQRCLGMWRAAVASKAKQRRGHSIEDSTPKKHDRRLDELPARRNHALGRWNRRSQTPNQACGGFVFGWVCVAGAAAKGFLAVESVATPRGKNNGARKT